MTGSRALAIRAVMRLAPALCGAIAGAALAEPGAQALGRAEAEVVVPIRAVPLADLSFGAIVLAAGGEGTVEIAADGSPPRYGNAARSGCTGRSDCVPHRARFAVSGEPDRTYRVVLPGSVVAYGARTGIGLPVTQLTVRSLNEPAQAAQGQLDKAGRDEFYVGGTLRLPPATRPDLFRADLSVIVTYN